MKTFLKNISPGFVKKWYSKLTSSEKSSENKSGWFGNYKTWNEALSNCSGYDNEIILNKVKDSVLKVARGEAEYERDGVAFDQHEYSEELLKAFKSAVTNNELSIIDFGGSLGSEYFQYRRFLKGVKLNWLVVEQKHFVDAGNKEIANEELHFFYTIEEALKYKKANVIVLSSVLPYLETPYEWINKIKSCNFDFIIIDRNAFMEGNTEMLTMQIVPEFIYKASYPAWFFNEKKFVSSFTDKYFVKSEFMSPFALPTIVNNTKAYWKGFLFEKKHD